MDVSLARLISEIEKEKEDDYNFFDQFHEEEDHYFTNTKTNTNNIINVDSFQTAARSKEDLDDITPKLGSIGGPIQISFGELINSEPQTNNRIISERNRRQKLGQNFISLAALIPGLKKMDKASILGGAIQYLKQSQENIKSLEKRIDNYHKNSQYLQMASDESNNIEKNGVEINARISGRNMLINVYCEKFGGFEAMLLSEITRLRVVIVNTSFLSFGLSHVEATIITQMECDFNMSVEDVVTTLQSIISSFMEPKLDRSDFITI